MFTKFDRILQLTIHILFLTLVFCLPLIFWIPSSEVFELPKMLFVYAMTALIAAGWAMRMILAGKIILRRTPLDIPILLFLISQIASTIYSIDPRISWYGWYGRFNGGLLSTISYTVLYYAFVSNQSSEFRVQRQEINSKFTIYSILTSAVIVSLYAIFQHFGIDRDFWVQDVATRVFSTQGQPNWLAAYLVMVIPLVMIGIIFNNDKSSPINTNKSMKKNNWVIGLLGYWLIGLFFIALLFTKSRSGLLGFAVADGVFWSLILFNYFNSSSRARNKATNREIQRSQVPAGTWRSDIKRPDSVGTRFLDIARNDGVPFLTIHLLLVVLIFVTNNPARDFFRNSVFSFSSFNLRPSAFGLQPSPIKSEFGGTESGDIRGIVWNGAVKLIKQRPLFGFGPETFGLTYWRVRPVEHNLTSEWNFLYNKAHNEWLNLAANTGLFGLGTHLLLLGWFSVWVLKGPALPQQGRALLNYAILAALLGSEVVNFFGFSTVTVGAYRYLFMGLAVIIGSKEQEARNNGKTRKLSLLPVSCFLFLIVVSLYLLSQISRLFWADLSYNRGRLLAEAGYTIESLPKLETAVELRPSEPTFRAQLAEIQSFLTRQLFLAKAPADQIKIFKDEARRNFQIAAGQSPFNLSLSRNQARATFALGEIDPALSQQGITLMKKALELAPTNPTLPLNLGMMYQSLGDNQTAAGYYQQSLKLKPDFEEAKKKLADLVSL